MGFFQKIIDDFGLGQHKVDEEALYAQIALFKDDLKEQEGKYTNQDEAIQFRDKWADLYKEAKAARLGKKSPLWEERKQFTDTFDRLAEVLTGYNSAVIAAESKRCDALLSDIDGKNLDPQQRAVVLCNEKRMLVLAGAGSGKTLTIAGKVKYLCQEKGVSPEDILLIAFTHKSAEEMTDRISGKLGIPVSATTFHKLGLDLIREAEGKRPDVYEGLTDFCRDYFQNVITTQAGQVRCNFLLKDAPLDKNGRGHADPSAIALTANDTLHSCPFRRWSVGSSNDKMAAYAPHLLPIRPETDKLPESAILHFSN